MKYEICKVKNDNGVKIYMTIAWTDNKVYAQDCVDALTLLHGCEYAVCIDGKPL